MSFDIYGNRLQRGHCEVHPHVHEEYPCSLCMAENRERSMYRQMEKDYSQAMERDYNDHMNREYNQGQQGEGI